MRIRIGYELVYEFPRPTPMILTLNVHYSRASDLLRPDHLITTPSIPVTSYRDSFGNWCSRLVAPQGRLRLTADALINDSGLPEVTLPNTWQTEVQNLPEETLLFLLGSRYCETDRLSDLAWSLFGGAPLGWARVQAICDYVHERIVFNYMDARNTRSAYEAHEERKGVCRDYAHLAIALCRCMNIPARYCTGYLGDIGVPILDPMDFSAWFEVYLGGRWWTMDARHNFPRIGRVLMATGRDAADVALTTAFGSANLKKFVVVSDEVAE